MIDWEAVLNQHGVTYATRGPNVARGAIAVRCPFCGPADPSQHMVVDLSGKGWVCRRSREHRGRSPARLLQALLGCSPAQAASIAGVQFLPDDLSSRVQGLLGAGNAPVPRRAALELLPEFKPFRDVPSVRPFINYLTSPKRGFARRDVFQMTDRYHLHYCTRGPFKGRVIFPVTFEKRLVTWTGRTIYPDQPLRYRTLSEDPEASRARGLPAALGPAPDYLLWYDDVRVADADTIVLVEGPFDALKIRVLGEREGVTATCVFTAEPSPRQVDALHALLPRFRRRFVLLDRGAFTTAMRVAASLSSLRVEPREMVGAKDPGELSTLSQLRDVLRV